MYPFPITTKTCLLLKNVGFLRFCEEDTPLKGNMHLLMQLIGSC
jgi:hypothetical protein